MNGTAPKLGVEKVPEKQASVQAPQLTERALALTTAEADKIRQLVNDGAMLVKHENGSMLLVTPEAKAKIVLLIELGKNMGIEVDGWGKMQTIGDVEVMHGFEVSPQWNAMISAPAHQIMKKLWELGKETPGSLNELLKNLTTDLAEHTKAYEKLAPYVDSRVGEEIIQELKSPHSERIFSSADQKKAFDENPQIAERWNELTNALVLNLYATIKWNQVLVDSQLSEFEKSGEIGGREPLGYAMRVIAESKQVALPETDAGALKRFFEDNKEQIQMSSYGAMNVKLVEKMNAPLLDWFVSNCMEINYSDGSKYVNDMKMLGRIKWGGLATEHSRTWLAEHGGGEKDLHIHYHPGHGEDVSSSTWLRPSAGDVIAWTNRGRIEGEKWAGICGADGTAFYRVSRETYSDLKQTGDVPLSFEKNDWVRKYTATPIIDKTKAAAELGITP